MVQGRAVRLNPAPVNFHVGSYSDFNRSDLKMSIARKLGIMVLFAVPGIVGGGIVFAIFHSYAAVGVYEILLLLAAGGYISR